MSVPYPLWPHQAFVVDPLAPRWPDWMADLRAGEEQLGRCFSSHWGRAIVTNTGPYQPLTPQAFLRMVLGEPVLTDDEILEEVR